MTDVENKVAVVTGAASGFGLGLAQRLSEAGAKVVLSDIEEEPLEAATIRLTKMGHQVAGVRADVSDWASVEALRVRTEQLFGPPQLVFNNAGVTTHDLSGWEVSKAAWEWVMGVNLWGPIIGCATFLPSMIQRGEGHVISTSSVVGLISTGRPNAPYITSKHGVIGLMGALYYELESMGSPVKVSVIPLGGVKSNLGSAARNYLSRFGNPKFEGAAAGPIIRGAEFERRAAPLEVAAQVLEGVRANKFWIWAGGAGPSERFRNRTPPFET